MDTLSEFQAVTMAVIQSKRAASLLSQSYLLAGIRRSTSLDIEAIADRLLRHYVLASAETGRVLDKSEVVAALRDAIGEPSIAQERRTV